MARFFFGGIRSLTSGVARNLETKTQEHSHNRCRNSAKLDPPIAAIYHTELSLYREALRHERQVERGAIAEKEARTIAPHPLGMLSLACFRLRPDI